MTDLIARLSAATEGSRELSDEVLRVFGWDTVGATSLWWRPPNKVEEEWRFDDQRPNPTVSLDDALSMAPKAFINISGPYLRDNNSFSVRFWPDAAIPSGDYGGKAATRALALSIAILRAKEAQRT